MGGNKIKKLKEMYDDIFSKGIEHYWKNEGCNSRMQKYKKLSTNLEGFNEAVKYLVIIALMIIATISIFMIAKGSYVNLIYDTDSLSVLILEVIQDFLEIMVVGSLAELILIRLGRNVDSKEYTKKLVISLPLFYLVYLYVFLTFNFEPVILLAIVYLLVINASQILISRINYLYDVASGIEEVNEEIIEVPEVNKKNKNKKGEKKNARKS